MSLVWQPIQKIAEPEEKACVHAEPPGYETEVGPQYN